VTLESKFMSNINHNNNKEFHGLEKHYSVKSAADIFDCSEAFFRNHVRDKKISYVKIGRSVRIPESELFKLMKYFPKISNADIFSKSQTRRMK